MTPPASDVQRGSVGLLTVLVGLLVTTVGLLLTVAAADVTVAAVRARTAADAAALAAAGAAPLAGGDGDMLSAAERLAAANGAQLVGCCGGRSRHDPRGGAPVVVVEVAVRPRLALLRAATVRARAAAGLRPGPAPAAFEAAR